MTKWKTEPIPDEDKGEGPGTAMRLVIREMSGCKIGVPLLGGLIPSRKEWGRIRSLVERFYERAYEEAPQVLTPQSAEPRDTIEYINVLRCGSQRRLVEECDGGGYVYFLRGEGFCKIGKTTQLDQRLKTLVIQLPFKVDLFHAIPTATPTSLEKQFHERFKDKRANGEWFKLEECDYEEILTWDRSYTPIDFALEADQEVTALHWAKVLNRPDVKPRFEDYGIEIESVEGWSAEQLAVANGQIVDFWNALDSLFSGERCGECGADIDITPAGRARQGYLGRLRDEAYMQDYTARAVVAMAQRWGIKLSVEGDELLYEDQSGFATEQVLICLKNHKAEILEILRERENAAAEGNPF